MTATDTEGAKPSRTIFHIPAINLNIFAFELSAWAGQTVLSGGKLLSQGCLEVFQLVEKTKKLIIAPMLPRNSVIGRPYSPLGVGGLSAVIGVSGALFGHNGFVRPHVVNSSAYTSNFSAQTLQSGAVLSSDIMVGSSKLQTVIPEGRTRDEVIMHKVLPGETLESIAKEYKVTVDSIKYVNNMEDEDMIKPSQELTILPVTGVLHEVASGETLESIAEKWKVPAQAIVNINWLDAPYTVSSGQKLVIPNAEIPKPVQESAPEATGLALSPQPSTSAPSQSSAPTAGTGKFLFPTSGSITQYFSYYHNGIDIGTMTSTPPIWAADSGVVTFAGWWNGGGGYSVWVDHGNGYVTQYAHMSRIAVSVGQSVSRGQQLGNVGATGLAFGNHLHFNVLHNGRIINPLSVL